MYIKHMKMCIDCKQTKPADAYHKRAAAKDGLQARCKDCNKAKAKEWQAKNPERHEEYWRTRDSDREFVRDKNFERRAKRYGLSTQQLQDMLDAANGKCEICGEEPHAWLVVDHCHDSLTVRGILCEKCNQALGLFRDKIEYMERAIQYLRKSKGL